MGSICAALKVAMIVFCSLLRECFASIDASQEAARTKQALASLAICYMFMLYLRPSLRVSRSSGPLTSIVRPTITVLSPDPPQARALNRDPPRRSRGKDPRSLLRCFRRDGRPSFRCVVSLKTGFFPSDRIKLILMDGTSLMIARSLDRCASCASSYIGEEE